VSVAWIETIPPAAAEGELAALYGAIAGARGGVAEVHRAASLNPRAVRAHLDLYRAVVFGRSPLSRVTRERIAVTVSAANECAYCVAHHAAALARLGDAPAVVEALSRGVIPDDLPAADQGLLRWAMCAALHPARCDEEAVVALRAAGFGDRAILDAALTVAYFAFVNRLVLTLGVSLEPGYEATCGDDARSA